MAEDMSDLINNLSSMLNGAEIPDNLKNIVENLNTSTDSSSNSSSNANSSPSISPEMMEMLMNILNSNNNSSSSSNSTYNDNDNGFHMDMATIMKLKMIMEKMNSKQNDPRTNLLLSLKPYLKDSRKNKVDQYIQFLKLGNVIDVLGPLGGEKKE